jgi:hypothetical protein
MLLKLPGIYHSLCRFENDLLSCTLYTLSYQLNILQLSFMPPLTTHHAIYQRRANNLASISFHSEKHGHRDTANQCYLVPQNRARTP